MKVKRKNDHSSKGPLNKKSKKSHHDSKKPHHGSKKPHHSSKKPGNKVVKNKGNKDKKKGSSDKNKGINDKSKGSNDKSKGSNDKPSKFEKPTVKSNFSNKSKNSKSFKKGKPNLDKERLIKKKQEGKPNSDKEKLNKTNDKENINENENGSTETPAGEKPNWLEYKKQQKELREQRRAKKLDETYGIAVEVKKIGEKLRRTKLSQEMQEKLTKKLHDLAQTHYAKLIFTHDLSRVIQWQIKYCNADIQLAIVEELKPHLQEMFYSKYAKNVIRTLLKRGSDNVKNCVLQMCNGHVVKLLSSVISASLFEKIYVEIASEAEKNAFKQEFYGDMYKKCKDPNIKCLTDVYKNSQGMKTATLSTLKANLIKILNKNLINSTLVHTVLYEYLLNCSKEDRAEIIALARELIAELTQTRDGAKVGNLCIWHGTNKDRKLIMKTLKEHIKDIITSEHGHLMILGLLDCVDDTVLLKKILLQEVLNNLQDIVSNEYGKRVILYIVARRDTHYFHPALVEYLKEGDNNENSKKPAEIREKELLDNVIDNLLESIANDANTWLSNGPIQVVTLAILKASHGDKPKSSFQSIAKFITDPESKIQKDATTTFEAVEDAGLHMVLKKLIQMDRKKAENNELTFGEVLYEYLTPEVIEHWINFNRGCFLLITLIENESEKVVSQLKSKLQKIHSLKSKKTKGATILLKKLD